MADNIAITAGSGTTVSTEEVTTLNGGAVSAQHVGRVIQSARTADGTAVDIAKAEDAAHTSGDPGLPMLGVRQDTAASLAGTDGDYTMPIFDANGRQHVLDQNSAAIKTAVELIDNAISGSEMQVDVVAALPAGTNAIGKLAANSGVDIGDVDVTSVIPGTGATNLGKAIDTATGATDTGVLALATRDDALGALTPIEGDNVQLRTDANGALWTHDDALDAALSGSELQVDVVAALPAGTNAIGKLAANSGVDIGDVDVTSVTPGTTASALGKAEDGAHASGDTGVMALGVRDDSPDTAFSGTDGDYTPIATTSTGAVRTAPISEDFAALANGPQVKKYYTNAGAVTDGIIWSPAAGKRWYVTDIFINVSAAATVTLEDDLAGGDSAVWKAELAANSGWSHSFNTPLFSGEDAADLIVTTSAGNVYITVVGYEI